MQETFIYSQVMQKFLFKFKVQTLRLLLENDYQ